MKLFDLHCDTATLLYRNRLSFENSITHVNAGNVANHQVTQCFAVFFDDRRPDGLGRDFFKAVAETVFPRLNRPGLTPVLTLEGGGVLATDDGWIDLVQSYGCRMAGLVWNGKNPLATGAITDDGAPLTPMGREAVFELIRRSIAVDVSHLSAAGTEEILSITSAPIAASHSNAKAVHNHLRNLSDSVAMEIFRRGGVVGLNLYPEFLAKENASVDDLLRHADHFLCLGGENGLALGCDLDGVDALPRGITDFASLPFVYQRFCEAFGTTVADNIFYRNAQAFFDRI